MKVKIFTHISYIMLLVFVYLPVAIIVTFLAFKDLSDINAFKIISMSFAWILFFGAILVFNRMCPVLVYDNNKETISRRGFLFGYKYTLKTTEILFVSKVELQIDGKYYVLVDGKHNGFYVYSNNAPIRIPFNKKGMEFIKLFYDGPLPF